LVELGWAIRRRPKVAPSRVSASSLSITDANPRSPVGDDPSPESDVVLGLILGELAVIRNSVSHLGAILAEIAARRQS